jgi:hypothetical protein
MNRSKSMYLKIRIRICDFESYGGSIYLMLADPDPCMYPNFTDPVDVSEYYKFGSMYLNITDPDPCI